MDEQKELAAEAKEYGLNVIYDCWMKMKIGDMAFGLAEAFQAGMDHANSSKKSVCITFGEFKKCESCANDSMLCDSCLHNKLLIADLKRFIEGSKT